MKSLTYYSSLYTISAIIVKSTAFLSILWIGKNFNADEYAYFALLFSFHQGISTFGAAGIKEAVVGFFKNISSSQERELLFSNVALSVLPSILLILFFSLIIYFFHLEDNNPDLIFVCFYFTLFSGILTSISIFKSHMNRLNEDHFGSIIYLFIPQLIIFISGIFSILVYNNPQYFFIGSSMSLIIFLFVIKLLYNKNVLKLNYSDITKKIIYASLPYFVIAFTGWLKGYGNNFIINIYLDNFEIAAYSFLFTFSGILLMISDSLNTVWTPRIFNTFSKSPLEKIEKQNNFFYGLLAIILGIVVSIILLIYPYLLQFIGGNLVLYSKMPFELYLVLLSYIIYTPIWHYRIHYYVHSQGKKLMSITIKSSILGLLNIIFCIKYLGSIGIYLGFLSFTIINLFYIVFSSYKRWDLKINWFGVLIGCLISSASFFIIYIEKNILLSIVFIIISMLATLIYIKNTKSKLSIS